MSESADLKAVKLPYFHRKLSEEDTALIGDITPKRIEASTTTTVEPRTATEGSAWNSAQTWEERDLSTWGKQKVRDILDASTDNDVTIASVTKLDGTANITHIRGRARFMFEWTLTCDWTTMIDGKSYNGSVEVLEATNDQLEDLLDEMTVNVKSKTPTSSVKAQVVDKVKRAIIAKLQTFEREFREYRG